MHDEPTSGDGPRGEHGQSSDRRLFGELAALGLRPSDLIRGRFPERYERVREIGRGGQGVVWEATDIETGERVAVKLESPQRDRAPEDHRRFEREIQLLASLEHPGITPVLSHGVLRGRPWYAMPLRAGVDVVTWARANDHDPARVVPLFCALCETVAAAHRLSVVHRDVKPSNVLVNVSGQPTVLDFGLAKRVASSASTSLHVTAEGAFVGTPLWLAPEQVFDPKKVGPATDVYSLGRLLYFMLSDRHPYEEAPGSYEWFQRIRSDSPIPLRKHRLSSGVDRRLERLVLSAIHADSDQRPVDAGSFAVLCAPFEPGRAGGIGAWVRKLSSRSRQRARARRADNDPSG